MTVPAGREPGSVVDPPAPPRRDVGPAPTVFGPTGVDTGGLAGTGGKLTVRTVTGDPTTIRVHGELLQETAHTFTDAVADLGDDVRVGHLVVDLTEASFMDSTGLGTLVSLRNQVLRRGGRFELVRPADRVFRLFELTRLDTVFVFVDPS